jgi:type IV secretory pathway VirB9-like protein
MRVAGDRRPRYALAQGPSAPIYEFTIERRTTLIGAAFRFDADKATARARQAATQARDFAATIRASTSAEAVAAFVAATGEEPRTVTQRNCDREYDVPIARVDVIVTHLAQVTP